MTFLSAEELEQLTGRRRPSAQIRWLRERRWAFTVRADGRPVVATAEAERQLCTSQRSRREEQEPDLAALDRLG